MNKLFIMVMLFLLYLNPIYADGCFVWKSGVDLEEPSQKAVICFREGVETMVLQVKFKGVAEDFAWIVPLPSKPDIDVIEPDKSPFAELSLYTQRRNRWGYRDAGAKQESEKKVEVLERKVVGVYDVAVLKSEDSSALSEWLKKHGFKFPDKGKNVLDHYTKKNWVYVAMRIDRKSIKEDTSEKLSKGALQPVRFSFKTEKAVYPLKISSLNSGKTDVLLYMLSDIPLHTEKKLKQRGFDIESNIPGHIIMSSDYQDPEYCIYSKVSSKKLPLTWKAVNVEKATSLFLCKYRGIFETKDMTDDLLFKTFDPEKYYTAKLKKSDNMAWQLQIISFLMKHNEKKYAKMQQDILIKMSQSDSIKDKTIAALHIKTPIECLKKLAEISDINIAIALTKNPNTPPDILKNIFARQKGDFNALQHYMAKNSSTPSQVLMEISESGSLSNNDLVFTNKNLSPHHLEKLSYSPSFVIRGYVAKSENCPPEILRSLLSDNNRSVRWAAAQNPFLLMKDLVDLMKSSDGSLRSCVAISPRATAVMLETLAKDKYDGVRAAVAMNSKTPAALLVTLGDDPEEYVRKYVASNPKTPLKVLEKLLSDRDESVRYQLAENPQITDTIAFKLAKDKSMRVRSRLAEAKSLSNKVSMILAEDEERYVRRILAEKTTSAKALAFLAKDEDYNIRWRVAENTNTSTESLKILEEDKYPAVRKHAERQLSQRKKQKE